MNKITGILVVILLSINLSKAQSDTLNKINAKGKKQGYWLCYLDDKFKITDSLRAVYVGFDLYDDGQNLTRIRKGRSLKHGKVVDSIIPSNDNKFSRLKLLNGKILFYNDKNLLTAAEIFSNGYLIKEYITYSYYDVRTYNTRPECVEKMTEILDFTKLYNNIRGTFYCEFRYCSGNIEKKYWFRKGKSKWKLYEIKN